MTKKRIWPVLAIFFGILTSIVGAAFIAGYFVEAIVKRTGDPDQSLLFWYLPILFMGFAGLGIGVNLTIYGFVRFKGISQSDLMQR